MALAPLPSWLPAERMIPCWQRSVREAVKLVSRDERLTGPAVAPGTPTREPGNEAPAVCRLLDQVAESVLSASADQTAGVDIAVRYRPAKAGSLVAGDWYDVLQLANGDLLLVVGDIAGHGIEAVTSMVAARNALRELAVTEAEPHELLSQLNYAACRLTEGVTGTVICGRYDPGTQKFRWARAGHLPPVLVRGGVAVIQPTPEGMMLGVELDTGFEQVTLQLRTGDTLLLYTDGLIEHRAASITDALAEFAAAAVPAGPDADSHAARIMAAVTSDTGDDACLLAVRIR
jgi:serine phosphatase RsbU (regulator of sigma subunit)